MTGLDREGCARPTLAGDLRPGDLIIEEGEDWWTEWYVLGTLAQDDETLAVLLAESGELRSWSGPSDTRHFVLRAERRRREGGRYARA